MTSDLTRHARKIGRNRADRITIMAEAGVAALAALADGMTEVDVAKSLGVNRLTVRKWAGK